MRSEHYAKSKKIRFGKLLFVGIVTSLFGWLVGNYYFDNTFTQGAYTSTSPAVMNSVGTQALIKNEQEENLRKLLAQGVGANPAIPKNVTATIVPVVRDSTTIDILLAANTHALNAGEVELFFDPVQLVVKDFIITDSLCQEQFVITKQIDNEQGRLFYQCGTLDPFVGTSTTLAVISVSPQTFGTSTLLFGSRTHILAHDGYGTSILKSANSAIYSNSLPTIDSVIQNE